MDTSAIDNVLAQLRAVAAGAVQQGHAPNKVPAGTDFASVLKGALDGVNAHQVDAARLAHDFELGAPNASLNDVMISMQKANLSFQQMVQVRNRLVSAYRDIMNMQV
jgi:flagellar hook-basal body complex protein FliE